MTNSIANNVIRIPANIKENFFRYWLEFLFDVLKYKDVFNVDFVNRTVAEIEEALTIKPQEENEQTSSN